MGKIGTFTFVSLDGYYKGDNNDTSWNNHGEEENAFAAENANSNPSGILLFGRVTYQMMAGFWPTPMAMESIPVVAKAMNASRKIVFSKTLSAATWNNTQLIKGDLISEIQKLKDTPGADVTILGSGSIITQLAAHNLIDHYQIMLNPVAIGSGTPLFKDISRLNLKLTKTRTFKSGVVLLSYECIK